MRGCSGELRSRLRADRAIAQAGRASGSADLASRLHAAPGAEAGDAIAGDVLLATAVAMIQSPGA